MKERPILFSAPMVRAILEGRKTQTRRVVSDRNSQGNYKASCLHIEDAFTDPGPSPAGNPGPYLKAEVIGSRDITERLYPRFVPGDRLWVRETFHAFPDGRIRYRCDPLFEFSGTFDEPWTPSIFMPRSASRITLEVTGVRVERLQAISEEDAMAEGAPPILVPPDGGSEPHVEGFRDLWGSINGPGSWDANPWVWVIEFRAAGGE